MADLIIEDGELVVRLSTLEKAGAIRGDVRVPLSAVTGVRVSETPFEVIRGLRALGLARDVRVPTAAEIQRAREGAREALDADAA